MFGNLPSGIFYTFCFFACKSF